MKALKIFVVAVSALAIVSCEPTVPGKTELGNPPVADFTQSFVDSNTVRLISTSSGDPFLFQWEIDGVGTYSGDSVDVFIPTIGNYSIVHNVFNQGGSATDSGSVEILRDAPFVCTGTAEYLTDCTSRTWKMAPVAGALWVGPLDGSSTWWAIGATGATDRPCHWNDEWTFNSDLEMVYETNGDLWAETYMGAAADGCQDTTFYTGNLEAWGDGTHSYEVLLGTGPNGEDQIRVSGLGAWIGLQKAANAGETTVPVASITYTILSAEEDANTGVRTMEIECNCTSLLWRFTLRSE